MGNASREDDANKGLSRRGFLVAGGAATATAAAGTLFGRVGVAAADADGEGDPLGVSVNGTIDGIVGGSIRLRDASPSTDPVAPSQVDAGRLTLEVESDCKFSRTGPATLNDFVEGDRVVAYVRVSGETVSVWALEPLCDAVNAVVKSRSGDSLETDQGTVVLNDYTIYRDNEGGPILESSSGIKEGVRIFATCRLDPSSGEYVAQNIAAVPA